MIDIMLDLETLGTAPGSVILSIGAATSTDATFDRKIDLADSLYRGLNADISTLAWWRQQSSAAWEEATRNGERYGLPASLHSLSQWLLVLRAGDGKTGERLRLWGDGANFDITMLECAYRACNIAVPWSYREVYCYRTLRQLLNSEKPASTLAHSAVSDAQAQLEHLANLLKQVPVWMPVREQP